MSKIEELRLRAQKEWENKTALDSKATSIITIAGTITTLVFGFVTFATSLNNFELSNYAQLIIVAGIITDIISILFAIWSIKLEPYAFVFKIRDFYVYG